MIFEKAYTIYFYLYPPYGGVRGTGAHPRADSCA
jgi:hypothetical protein